ncbi:unnamed protein product [Discosporangium mesarthrocarpum]
MCPGLRHVSILVLWGSAHGFVQSPRSDFSSQINSAACGRYARGGSAICPVQGAPLKSGPCGLLMSSTGDSATAAEEKAAELRKMAAELRAQASELEAKYAVEKREASEKWFETLDSNDDNVVDLQELQAGLEGQLRRDFVRRLTKRLNRQPTQQEIERKISEMPGGSLFPEEVGRMLLEIYDNNGDGVLQLDEFVPAEDMRVRLNQIMEERAQAERTAERAAKEKELEERGIKKIKDEARAAGLPLPEDFNNAPPTIADRFLSALPYLLPLTDSLSYGGHIFSTFPEQLEVFSPLVAILLAYRAIPFSQLIAFFGLQFLATKPEVNKLVRFNLRQAVNLDVALFFPSLLGLLAKIVVGDDPTGKLPPLANAGSDIVFAAVILAVLYSCVSSALGIIPTKLPVLGKMNRENPDRDSDDFYTPGGGRR